jgi:hypothetical protein
MFVRSGQSELGFLVVGSLLTRRLFLVFLTANTVNFTKTLNKDLQLCTRV